MSDKPRLIDGIVLTKFDTIDDKVRPPILLPIWFLLHVSGLSFATAKEASRHSTLPPAAFSSLQVGAAISMTYITGQPIVFVGTGQTYNDLRSLNARAVVGALMKA